MPQDGQCQNSSCVRNQHHELLGWLDLKLVSYSKLFIGPLLHSMQRACKITSIVVCGVLNKYCVHLRQKTKKRTEIWETLKTGLYCSWVMLTSPGVSWPAAACRSLSSLSLSCRSRSCLSLSCRSRSCCSNLCCSNLHTNKHICQRQIHVNRLKIKSVDGQDRQMTLEIIILYLAVVIRQISH